jgi:hypothetical protein
VVEVEGGFARRGVGNPQDVMRNRSRPSSVMQADVREQGGWKLIGRACLIFLVAALLANLVWGAYGAVIWPLHTGFTADLSDVFYRFLFTLFWSGALTVFLAVPYTASIIAWLFLERSGILKPTMRHVGIASAVLAAPLAVGVAHASVLPSWAPDRNYMSEFVGTFPFVFAVTWLGLFVSRMLFVRHSGPAFGQPQAVEHRPEG